MDSPPPPPPPWEGLFADLLVSIAGRLACLVDRAHMSRVCRSWREAVRRLGRPRQLPWLLLPYRSTKRLPLDVARTASFFCLLGSHIHRVRIGSDTGGARFFGSYEGGWVFLAHDQTRGHALVNLHTDRRIPLPDSIWWAERVEDREPSSIQRCRMIILAATLSTSPPVPTEKCIAAMLSSPPAQTGRCVAAAIVEILSSTVTGRQIAFWRMGHDQVAFGWSWGVPHYEIQDVIYYIGAFHFLTEHGDVLVCIPEFQEEGGLVAVQCGVRRFPPAWPEFGGNMSTTGRYLVESRRELLMVMKFAHPRLKFRVFQIEKLKLPEGTYVLSWTELRTLDGRMLFVARGCSRSYEVADFPGFADDVYFLDDRSSHFVSMISRSHWGRQYNCNDNGNFSTFISWYRRGPTSCPPPYRWFPGRDPSNYSSPIWFLP